MNPDACLHLLLARRHAQGGFLSREAGGVRPDSTAWAILALRAAEQHSDVIDSARTSLIEGQLSDGRIAVLPHNPSACWPTPLALLAWWGWQGGVEVANRAIQFLNEVRVQTWEIDPVENQIDPRLKGWAWVAGTSCWVEPTALAIFAIERYGPRTDRTNEGVRLLLDRQLPKGGWNFGNTVVYGSELYPTEETVGVVLTALADHCEQPKVERSISFIEQRLQRIRTPLTLAWGILGLAAWGRRPANADEWIAECLDRQKLFGPFDTSHLALLFVASRCTRGLIELFPS
ncbi:hypothetical protein ACXR0O_08640 [Verrucomicrobiota bacterium sgz303538]